jgi:ribosomal protein S18 acetylase RimI-like enzyme
MSHLLDRPVWSALASTHAGLAVGDGAARRYRPGLVAFAAARDADPDAGAGLVRLVGHQDSVVMVEAEPVALPPGLVATSIARAVQMHSMLSFRPVADPRLVRLGPDDTPEMFALAELTQPGPFTPEALALGSFIGLRDGDRLAAMAGERMAQTGFRELSGVCVHPDYRGRGYARLLSLKVAGQICDRGERPYLHAYAVNEAAIGLYRSIGFVVRAEMTVTVARRG